MPLDPLGQTREWLRYADEDLASCRVLMEAPEALLGTAAYHAQQAAEKALKAFLFANKQPLVRTHGVLVTGCERLDGSFASLRAPAARLTPYATVHRYPGFADLPMRVDVAQARVDAEVILQLVLGKLAA